MPAKPAATAAIALLATAGHAQTVFLGPGNDFQNAPNWSAGLPGPALAGTIDGNPGTSRTVTLGGNADFTVLGLQIDAGDTLNINNVSEIDILSAGGLLNNGTINIFGSGSNTGLFFDGSQTVVGDGQIILNNGATTNTYVRTNAGSTITNNASHDILGGGQILNNNGTVHNDGRIIATLGLLSLNPGDAETFVNDGVLDAIGNGVTLRLGRATYDNNASIRAIDDATVEFQALAVVEGGTLSSSSGGTIVAGNGSEFNDITVAAGTVVEQPNAADVDLRGGLVNNGSWTLSPTGGGGSTVLVFLDSPAQSITGPGEIILTDGSESTIRATNIDLTIGGQQTIRGAGDILANSGGLIIDGVVLAQGNDRLDLDPGSGREAVINGTLRAEGPGGLLLSAGAYTNNSTIEVADGSQLRTSGAVTITGGNIETVGSGEFRIGTGTRLDSVQINAGSVVRQPNAADVFIQSSAFHLEGTWLLDSDTMVGGSTVLGFVGINPVLTGSGELVGTERDDIQITLTGSTNVLTIDTNMTYRGAGRILNNTGGLINNGTILANTGAGIEIDPGNSSSFTNNGTFQATDDVDLLLSSGLHILNSPIQIGNNSRVTTESSTILQGGSIFSVAQGFLDAATGTTFDGFTIGAGMVTTQVNAADFFIQNGLTHDGTWIVDDDPNTGGGTIVSFLGGDQTLAGAGTMLLADDTGIQIRSVGVVTHGPNHTMRGVARLLANSGGMINQGIITAVGTNPFQINPGSGFTFENTPGGTLAGTGRFEFLDGSFTNDGDIAPGLRTVPGIGDLTIQASITNTATSVHDFELGAAPTADTLAVEGDHTVAGTLRLTATSPLSEGDTFQIITTTGALSGTFDTIELLGADPTLAANFSILDGVTDTGIVLVTTAPGCNAADVVPDNMLDLQDVQTFLIGFAGMQPVADVVQDGMFDLQDVQTFLILFGQGCPS